MNKRPLLRRLLRGLLVALLALVILLIARGLWAFRDRSGGYTLDLRVESTPAKAAAHAFQAGFGRVKINPDLSDPKRPVYVAGFDQNRIATALHDDLWAIAAVFDDGQTRLGIVALDAIGFFHDDVVAVRTAVPVEWKLAYTVVASTHNHSTPDLMGLWGPNLFTTGVNARYRQQVQRACVEALGQAVAALQPARLALHEIPAPTDGLVEDTRKPTVFDPDLRVMQVLSTANSTTLGSIVGWANHPETPWAHNTEITADYCGYLRDALERGVTNAGRVLASGVGGIHLYVNGAVGGLITTRPGVTVRDPYLDEEFSKPSHEKARAVGHKLASLVLPRLADSNTLATAAAVVPIGIRARTFEVPLDNLAYVAAAYLGLMDRGQPAWRRLRTEAALLTIGDASIACVPGELYPEIVNGGIERAPGGDFDLEPVEVPPIRALMPGQVKFLFGLANDELGYLIPKSEWDQKAPYLYGSTHRVYGEVNSCGPDTARLVHATLRELCGGAK